MSLHSLLTLAQATTTAAPAADTATPLIKPDHRILARFEEATGLPPEVAMWGMNIVAAIAVLVIGYIAAGIARNLIRRLLAKRNIDGTVSDFVGNLAHAAIMTFVAITALSQLGVDTKTFAAVIAAAGLAIGLALQGGLSNFAAGFLIVVFRPFKKGDAINGACIEGVVEEVQVFSTTLHTPDNKKIIVPNSALMGGTITNYTANSTRRADLAFGIGAGQSLPKAHQALLSAALSDPRTLKDPAPTVANTKLIDGGTLIELRAWCKTTDFASYSSDLIPLATEALGAAGIKGPDKSVTFVERAK